MAAAFLASCSIVMRQKSGQAESSEEVAKLELIASGDGSNDTKNVQLGASGKEHRTAAYIKLGAIGTKESLAAARRVEAKSKTMPMLPATVPLGVWPHPMWHFGDAEIKPIASTKAPDGTSYAIVSDDLLGDDTDLFLISIWVVNLDKKTRREIPVRGKLRIGVAYFVSEDAWKRNRQWYKDPPSYLDPEPPHDLAQDLTPKHTSVFAAIPCSDSECEADCAKPPKGVAGESRAVPDVYFIAPDWNVRGKLLTDELTGKFPTCGGGDRPDVL